MENYYRLDKLVMVKFNKAHIGYFGYLIIVGPRGGRYLLDQFNTEVMFKRAIANIITQISACGAIYRYMAVNNKIQHLTVSINDGSININGFAKEEGATLLKGKGGMEQARSIGRQLDIGTKEALVEIMVDNRGGI